MEENPLVSVCIPAYNAEKYIEETLHSLISQTYNPIEIIVVNDGSTDKTGLILEQYKKANIQVIHQQNSGQSTAANTAFKHAKGLLIKFMDADDLISPSFIEQQVKHFYNQKNIIVSATWGRFYNDDLATFKICKEEKLYKNQPPNTWLINAWKNADTMMQCALWLIPKTILEKSGLWDESLSLINDLDFFTRVLLSSDGVVFEKEAVLYYRSGNKTSLSARKSNKAIQSAFRSIDQATTNLLKADTGKEAKTACANQWQSFIYTIYPEYHNLLKLAGKKVRELGGYTLQFPAGGYTKIVASIIGWKATKRIKALLT